MKLNAHLHDVCRVMRTNTLARATCGLLMLAPLAVSSTSPSPPPGNGFSLDGTITRASGGSLANHVVVPIVWNIAPGDGEVGFGCEDAGYFPNRTHALTDAAGRFELGFWSCETPETLAVAVLTPDTLIMGSVVPMDALRGSYQVNTGEFERAGSGGCDGGAGVKERRITSYIYYTDGLTIHVP